MDPDQQQKWTNNYNTNNYVRYQPSSYGYPAYVHPTYPEVALVIAQGTSGYEDLVVALGAVDERAFVTHGGFLNTDPLQWYNVGGEWLNYGGASCTDSSCMNYADEAITLVFKEPIVQPGETTCFRTFYALSKDYEMEIASEETQCYNMNELLTCDMVAAMGLCAKRSESTGALFQQICPKTCGCCNVGSECWCNDEVTAHKISNLFGFDLTCQQAADKYGCNHGFVGRLLRQYCPCSCPSTQVPSKANDQPSVVEKEVNEFHQFSTIGQHLFAKKAV